MTNNKINYSNQQLYRFLCILSIGALKTKKTLKYFKAFAKN